MLPEQKAYIFAWVDGRHRCWIPCGNLLFRHGLERRGKCRHRGRHSAERGFAQDRVLGYERRVSAIARMYISSPASQPSSERSSLCRGLAICAIASAEGRSGTLHQVQRRRQLLSAWEFSCGRTAY